MPSQMPADPAKPLLLIDVDGVVSLWGFAPERRPPGTFASVEGVVHFLSVEAAGHLLDLVSDFFPVWCTGWEERANENLPGALGLGPWPYLSFARDLSPGGVTPGHWKLEAIDAYAGARPLAWVDDALDVACDAWAAARPGPTLLVPTDPAVGLTEADADRLLLWSSNVSCSN